MGRFTGVLGLLTMLGLAYLFSTNRRAIKLKMVIWGLSLQIALRVSGVLLDLRADAVFPRRRRREQAAGLCVCGIGICVWRTREAAFLDRIHLRVSGFADDYFHRVAVCAAVLPRRDAGGDSRGGVGDAAGHGRERRGVAQRRGEYFHGADGSAADDPAVSAGLNAIRVDDHHDQRDGARFGRDHGGLYRVRSGSAAPADGGDHDRAGNAAHFQNAGAGNRAAENHGRRAHGTRRARLELSGGHCARDGRRSGHGDQRGGDADCVPGADRACQRHPGRSSQLARRARHPVVSGEPATDLRLGLCAGGVDHRRAVARLRADRKSAGHADGAQRTGGVFVSSVR